MNTLHLHAESVKVDDDEGQFTLEIEGDDQHFSVNIHGIDLDAFYDSVKARIGPYLRERDEARREYDRRVVAIREDGSYRFECDDPEDAWVEMMRDNADHSRKVAKGE